MSSPSAWPPDFKRLGRLKSGGQAGGELMHSVLVDDVAAISIQREPAEGLGDLQRKQQMCAAIHQPLRPNGVEAELGIHGEIEAALLLVHEAPLDPKISVARFGVGS